MRLHRLEISNFGGVDHAEVNFRVDGVTVVEGPNEAGKTTLRDAFARLLDTKANSSNKSKIGKYFPVHKDVGPEVTAEFTTGPYRLVYTKQWKTGKRTELKILEPSNESLTGDSAHDRVEEILKETLDPGLWAVLQHTQGAGWDEFTPVESTAFLGALDAASGGEKFSQDGSSDSLWDRVQAEREQYFTNTGRARGDLQSAPVALVEAQDRLKAVDDELGAIESDAALHAELTARKSENEREQIEAGEAFEAATTAWSEIAGLQTKRSEAGHVVSGAQARRDAALGAVGARKRLAKNASESRASLERLKASAGAVEKEVAELKAGAESARERHAKAADALEKAIVAEGKADELLQMIEDWHSLADRKTRRDTATAEVARIAEAESTLETNLVNDEALEALTQADAQMREAAARLDAAKLTVRLEATASVNVGSPAGESVLDDGDNIEFDVAAGDTISIGDLVRLEVLGTDEQRDLAADLASATSELKGIAKRLGLSGDDILKAASTRNRERDRAEQTLETSRAALQDALQDLTYEELIGKVERQEARFARYGDKANSEDLNDSAAATKAKEEASQARALAGSEVEDLLAARDEAVEVYASAREKLAGSNAAVDAAAARAAADEGELEASRKSDGSDEKLDRDLADLEAELKKSIEAEADIEKQLASLNADARGAERDAASGRVQRLARESREVEAELNQVTGRLGRDSGKGLLETKNKAESDVAHAEREDAAVAQRAAAVKLLHDTLAKHRDAARRAVVSPYTERINRLGKIVFGPDVEFEVSADDLTIKSRTLDGRTVAFGSLSGGAKEQIGVISALACAELVAANEEARDRGAPIVLDDALGFSDDGRLTRLGAVFSATSDDCQVIILTCNRDRYKSIGDADFVRFGAAAPAAGAGDSMADARPTEGRTND